MLGAILAGVQVAGGIAGFMSSRKEKKWGRRNARAAQRSADERLQQMDQAIQGAQGERQFQMERRDADVARYDDIGYDQIERNLGAEVREGIDIEGEADLASERATNQYDVSMDAQQRAMRARGVRPGSQAMSRLGEDAAFDRARLAAGSGNQARREADDRNFARTLAFTDRGERARNNIAGQSANIAGQFRGEYGMQGQIRGEYLDERNHQYDRAEAGRQGMVGAAASLGSGLIGGAASGDFGKNLQNQAQQYAGIQGRT